MRQWEAFDPRDGVTVRRFFTRFGARRFVRRDGRLDYARIGEGWV